MFRSNLPIAAERAVYWGHGGVWTEGHDSPGVTQESTRWGFAEGSSENGFDTYILVQNASASDITVRATFLCEDGTGVTRDYLVRGESRFDISRANLPGELNGLRFATMLESSTPFVAERATYWGTGWNGGHASAGTPWSSAIPTPPPASIRTPTLTSVSPASGPTAGGTTVTLTGTDFLAGATVSFGGVLATSATIPLGNSTTITAVTPPHAGGAVDVVVTNPNGRLATLVGGYTYVSPVPVLLVEDTLAFGDSITDGKTAIVIDGSLVSVMVPESSTYPSVLASRLAARYPAQAAAISVQNAGVSGEYTDEGMVRLPTVMTSEHDLVIILEGVNDTNLHIPAAEIAAHLRTMVDTALAANKRVILSTLTPVIRKAVPDENGEYTYKADPAMVAALNDAIRVVAQNYAADSRFLLVDMFAAFPADQLTTLLSPDGLHPSEAGYAFMAQAYFDAIVAHFAIGG